MLFQILFPIVSMVISTSSQAAETKCQNLDGHINNQPAHACVSFEKDGKASGQYFYYKHNQSIPLKGTWNVKNSTFEISEFGEPKDALKSTGTWKGKWNAKDSVLEGHFLAEKKESPLGFRSFDGKVFETEKKSLKDSKCDSENEVVLETSLDWDEVKYSIVPNLQEKINDLTTKDRAAFTKAKKKPSNCKFETLWDESTRVSVSRLGKFLIQVQQMSGGFSGGAHPYESGSVEFYDLRTGKPFLFTQFFTDKGFEVLKKTISKDIGGEEDEDASEMDCNFEYNKLWGIDNEKKAKDFSGWQVSYGTYAFGCTGRPGYFMDKIPPDLIENGLNPVYFDLKTKNFYE